MPAFAGNRQEQTRQSLTSAFHFWANKSCCSIIDPISDVRSTMYDAAMKVTIYEADNPIGKAEVFALDPPMGVAMAKFEPLAGYDLEQHANVVNGDYIEDRGEHLRIEMADGVPLISQTISIQDWPALGEREVHIIGILEPSFEALFGEHPDFKSYRGKP